MLECPSISQLYVCLSTQLSIFCFRMKTSKHQWIFTNLVCALTELSARDMPIFLFPDDNLSKCQGILTKLGTCINIKEICFWIANGQILLILDIFICSWHINGRVLSFYIFILHHTIVAGYYGFTLDVRVSVVLSSVCPSVCPSIFCLRMITWVKINGFSPNLVCALILWRSGLGLLMGKFRQILWSYLPETRPYFRFRMITWVNNKGF